MRPFIHLAFTVADEMSERLPPWIEQGELVSIALQRFQHIHEKFDPAGGVKFVTYCRFKFRYAMLDFLRTQDHISRKYRKDISQIERTGKPMPTHLAVMAAPVQSIERDILHSHPKSTFDDPAGGARQAELLEKIKTLLRPREALIVERHILHEYTFKEVAEHLGCSESRVCQLYGKAIRRLQLRLKIG